MRNRSKLITSGIATFCLIATGGWIALWQEFAWGADVIGVFSNIVGLKLVDVNEGWNVLSVPLVPCSMTDGTVTGVATGKIVDSSASWKPNEHAGCCVRVTKGAQILSYFITGNTATEFTVTKGDPKADGVVAGNTYRVRPSLECMFGGPDGPLTGGDGFTSPSDEIVTWNAATQKVGGSAYLRDIPSLGLEGWFDVVWNPSDLDIDAHMGFWLRHYGDAVRLSLHGHVQCAACVSTVEGGWNLLGVSIPCPECLNKVGDDETQLESWGTAGDMITQPADQIAVWDSAKQKISDSAFLSSVTGYEGWLDSVWNPSPIVVSPGQGFWYWAVRDFVWQDVPPYAF